MGQPWFQARMAMPNAAVDLPFISPVWTASSGRFRRCRVLSPSSGTTATCPFGMSSRLLHGPDGAGQRLCGQLLQAQGPRAQRGAEGAGEPQPDRARLAVDDDGRRPRRGQQSGGGVRVGEVVAAACPGGAAVGDDDEQRTAPWIADPLHPQHLVGAQQARGPRRAASGGGSGPAAGGGRRRGGGGAGGPAPASTDHGGGSAPSASDPRKVTSPTLSRRW